MEEIEANLHFVLNKNRVDLKSEQKPLNFSRILIYNGIKFIVDGNKLTSLNNTLLNNVIYASRYRNKVYASTGKTIYIYDLDSCKYETIKADEEIVKVDGCDEYLGFLSDKGILKIYEHNKCISVKENVRDFVLPNIVIDKGEENFLAIFKLDEKRVLTVLTDDIFISNIDDYKNKLYEAENPLKHGDFDFDGSVVPNYYLCQFSEVILLVSTNSSKFVLLTNKLEEMELEEEIKVLSLRSNEDLEPCYLTGIDYWGGKIYMVDDSVLSEYEVKGIEGLELKNEKEVEIRLNKEFVINKNEIIEANVEAKEVDIKTNKEINMDEKVKNDADMKTNKEINEDEKDVDIKFNNESSKDKKIVEKKECMDFSNMKNLFDKEDSLKGSIKLGSNPKVVSDGNINFLDKYQNTNNAVNKQRELSDYKTFSGNEKNKDFNVITNSLQAAKSEKIDSNLKPVDKNLKEKKSHLEIQIKGLFEVFSKRIDDIIIDFTNLRVNKVDFPIYKQNIANFNILSEKLYKNFMILEQSNNVKDELMKNLNYIQQSLETSKSVDIENIKSSIKHFDRYIGAMHTSNKKVSPAHYTKPLCNKTNKIQIEFAPEKDIESEVRKTLESILSEQKDLNNDARYTQNSTSANNKPSKITLSVNPPTNNVSKVVEPNDNVQPSTTGANINQPSTPEVNINQPSTPRTNINQPSTQGANINQPSTSGANINQSSTFNLGATNSNFLKPNANLKTNVFGQTTPSSTNAPFNIASPAGTTTPPNVNRNIFGQETTQQQQPTFNSMFQNSTPSSIFQTVANGTNLNKPPQNQTNTPKEEQSGPNSFSNFANRFSGLFK